jgi:hypothetical protein
MVSHIKFLIMCNNINAGVQYFARSVTWSKKLLLYVLHLLMWHGDLVLWCWQNHFLGISAPSATQTFGVQLCTSSVTRYCSILLQQMTQDSSFHVRESGQDDLTRMMSYREVCLCQKIFICLWILLSSGMWMSSLVDVSQRNILPPLSNYWPLCHFSPLWGLRILWLVQWQVKKFVFDCLTMKCQDNKFLGVKVYERNECDWKWCGSKWEGVGEVRNW